MTGTLRERHEAKVDRSPGQGPNGDCHLWTASCRVVAQGYGQIWDDGRMLLAHRVAWEWAYGWPIGDLKCLHHCDNPPCVNPGHLFVGTHATNCADKEAKGRGNQPKGSDNGQAKLTEEDIPEIRRLLAQGVSGVHIARIYGVHRSIIVGIKTGKAWKHVQ